MEAGRRLGGRGLGGVDGQGEGPEMVGVAGGVASGGNGDAARGADETFGFAEVVAEDLVDGMLDVGCGRLRRLAIV